MSSRSVLDELAKDLVRKSGARAALVVALGTPYGDFGCPAIVGADLEEIAENRERLCSYLRYIIGQIEERPEERCSSEPLITPKAKA